jgi:hypothetical protein
MPKYAKLNSIKFGIAAGILTAICVFITTLLGTAGYCIECTNLLTSIYGSFGYSISFLGAIAGAIYGFIDMFIGVAIFAWIYNKLI